MLEPDFPLPPPATFNDIPLDAIEIIANQLASEYWETAAHIQHRSRIECRNSQCGQNPAFVLSSHDLEEVTDTVSRHFHSADLVHTRNIKLASHHHIDDSIAAEASPWLWNTWVIALSSLTRLLRREIFEERVMKTFYLQSLTPQIIEQAKNVFGRQRLADIQSVFIGFKIHDYDLDGPPTYFLDCFPRIRHVRKQWEQGNVPNYRRIAEPHPLDRQMNTILDGAGRHAWTWITIPGLRLESLDLQLSVGLLFSSLAPRSEESTRTSRITRRVSVRKVVLRENTSGNARPWMVPHQTAMARVLQNFQDIQELVLDFLIQKDARHLDDRHIFPQITPTRLRHCKKLTFRFIPWNTETFSADDVLDAFIKVIVDRFNHLEHIKVVLRTHDPNLQPVSPQLITETIPTRERIEAFVQQEILVLQDLQTVECMYVDRLRPLDPPVMHFFARVVVDEDSGQRRAQVEKAYWNPIRMHGFADSGAQLHLDLLSGTNTAANSDHARSRAPSEPVTEISDDSRSTSQEV